MIKDDHETKENENKEKEEENNKENIYINELNKTIYEDLKKLDVKHLNKNRGNINRKYSVLKLITLIPEDVDEYEYKDWINYTENKNVIDKLTKNFCRVTANYEIIKICKEISGKKIGGIDNDGRIVVMNDDDLLTLE